MNVLLSNQAKKFLERLNDEKAYNTISEIIEMLSIAPIPYAHYDLIKIKGSESDYRIRKGDFRISYFFDASQKIIYVGEIERREKAYKKF